MGSCKITSQQEQSDCCEIVLMNSFCWVNYLTYTTECNRVAHWTVDASFLLQQLTGSLHVSSLDCEHMTRCCLQNSCLLPKILSWMQGSLYPSDQNWPLSVQFHSKNKFCKQQILSCCCQCNTESCSNL